MKKLLKLLLISLLMITSTVNVFAEDNEEEITEEVNESYPIFLYALVPGVSEDAQVTPDNKWFGLGVSVLDTTVAPTELNIGDIVKEGGFYSTSYNGKPLYPNITFDGKEYKYATTNEQREEKGYYTLQPTRVKVDNGANAGNNKYNDVVPSGNTYHQDYTIVLNEKGTYTATFNVKYPESSYYTNLTNYSQRVKEDTLESSLRNPGQLGDELLGDITYKFDGWYLDTDCTVKANFDSAIKSNVTYYGKYVGQRKTIEIAALNAFKNYGDADPTFTTNDTHNIPDISLVRDNGEDVGNYTINISGPSSYGYYDINYVNGLFTINPISIKEAIKNDPSDIMYDGKSHKYVPEGLVKGRDYTIVYSTDNFTNSGEINVIIVGIGNYEGTYTASYNITKRTVDIKTYSATKEYDETPLVDKRVNITGDGFVEGEAVVKVNGTITNPGKALNGIIIEGNYNPNNYNISMDLGVLEVTEKKITPPIPTPEPSKPDDPTPAPVDPTPDVTPEPETTPEPAVKPTPAPAVIPTTKPDYTVPEDPLGINSKPKETEKPETTEVSEVEEIPEAPETAGIEDENTPETGSNSWALINLITVIVGVINSVLLFILKHNGENSNKTLAKMATIIFSVLSVLAFIVTEDMRLPMVLVDKYTIFMIILLVVNLLLWILKDNKEEEDE